VTSDRDQDPGLRRAQLRSELRDLEAQIRRVQRERATFCRYGFGSDVYDIQLEGLQVAREERLAALAQLQTRSPHVGGLRAWLLLPAFLGGMVLQVFQPRRRMLSRWRT
jgi:hypothetical protein